MVVLDEDYLIGKIIEVNFYTSRVLLLSDINSKIPVSIQPGDIQAIMSGNGEKTGILQYTKNSSLIENKEDMLVLTSGSGGVFKSGIPVGVIKKEEVILENNEKIVDFYQDFSQLKYVKIVSYFKGEETLDSTSKSDSKKLDSKIEESNQQREAVRILVEQKKIADEIRIKIEDENRDLKSKVIRLKNEMSSLKETIQKDEVRKEEILFLKLNNKYSRKCKKTLFNKLYVTGSEEYRKCILNKGKN